MTELVKSRWVSDGDTMRFSMPLSKVDEKNRLVSGWATMDNVDTQGDIVLAEASKRAFARARGNLREMHQPIAVGKIVDFREDEFYNEQDGKFYRGIFVTARVSEGAEDTWTKVLDGTLTGFSIGGSIIDASKEMTKDGSQQVRLVKDYDLVELSLVDNPANQLSNITGFQKTNIFTLNEENGSVTVKGMVADTQIENVFICNTDDSIVAKSDDSASCPKCGDAMKNIGWFESGNDRAEKVREIVTKFKTPETPEGGVEMSKEEITKADEPTETEGTEEVTEVEEEVTETPTAVDGETGETSDGEEAAEVEEVTDEEEVISKKIDELKTVVTETLEKTRTETSEAVNSLDEKVTAIAESFEKANTELADLKEKFDNFNQSLETEKSRLSALEERLNKFNSSEAFRKSADLSDESVVIKQKKPTWDGAFSIDNLR